MKFWKDYTYWYVSSCSSMKALCLGLATGCVCAATTSRMVAWTQHAAGAGTCHSGREEAAAHAGAPLVGTPVLVSPHHCLVSLAWKHQQCVLRVLFCLLHSTEASFTWHKPWQLIFLLQLLVYSFSSFCINFLPCSLSFQKAALHVDIMYGSVLLSGRETDYRFFLLYENTLLATVCEK